MNALSQGIKSTGDLITFDYDEADVVITFGLTPWSYIHDRARANNKPNVLIDFGYWDRLFPVKSIKNHYRFSVQYHHPTNYILEMNESKTRFHSYKKEILPWNKSGKYVLVADIGRKSYDFLGMEYQSWAKRAVKEIQQHTDRKIKYRPKPSSYTPIEDLGWPYVGFSDPRREKIEVALKDAFAVVTYYSNVGCDALLQGIPIFTEEGAAKGMGLQDFSQVDNPYYPDNRQQFFNNLAYCQWSVEEMSRGLPWQHLKEKLLPLVYEKKSFHIHS
jgi:hypothetical protein